MDLPVPLTKPDLSRLAANDTIPSNIDLSTISFIGKFLSVPLSFSVSYLSTKAGWYGMPITFNSTMPYTTSNPGWATVEAVLMQLNTSLTPSGRFSVYSDLPDTNTRIGYDAAVCVQLYEPWIIEAYNTSTGSPSALRIVEKGDGSTSLPPSGHIQGTPIANTRYLNATGKDIVFSFAQHNSIAQMWEIKFNRTETWGKFIPPPIVGPVVPPQRTLLLTSTTPQAAYFTEGAELGEYTELSPDRFAVVRARVGAVSTLPYFVGSGPVVAQSYADETRAYATYKEWQLIGLPIIVWILGTIGELFVPTLPLNVPRREFGIYSWLALFQSQARGFGRVPCARANRTMAFRSWNVRRPKTSLNS